MEATIAPPFGGGLSSLRVRWAGEWVETLYRANEFQPTEGWRGQAPLLWPAVGRNYTAEQLTAIREGEKPPRGAYCYRESTYPMPIHGFVMDLAWELMDHGADEKGAWATCALTSDDYTRDFYPFDFSLEATYILSQRRLTLCLVVAAAVENREAMFFSLGNHLTLRLPFTAAGRFEECVLRAPTRTKFDLTPESLLAGTRQELDLSVGMPLSREELHNLVIGAFAPDEVWVELRDPHSFGFRIAQREVPAGVEAPLKSQPEHFYFVFYGSAEQGFFCPEPWYGGPNSLNTQQGVIWLPPGETFTWEMEIAWLED